MERFAARGQEVVQAWDAHRSQCEAVRAACGQPAIEDRAMAASDASYELEQLAFAERATTLDGMRAKARMAARFIPDEPDGTYEDDLFHNILRDLLRT